MKITRRSAVGGLLAGVGTALSTKLGLAGTVRSPQVRPATGEPWTLDWDRALLLGLLKQMDRTYDPEVQMNKSYRGPEYNYQSTLRSMTVHPIRDAFDYVLAQLEEGSPPRIERACAVLDRTLRLQDGDPASKWFGLWSYYLEEPLPMMSTVDFNWADFNGSTLLLVVLRHDKKLPEDLQSRTRVAINQAAASIRRRDITPNYTNIIAQGTFVVFAAAELLGDKDLLAYSVQRMRRWAENVDRSGSFSEYNSPAYTPLTIENMTRLKMYVNHAEARVLGDRLHRRAWEQLAAHWHAPTMQLGGPMSRAYSNDIGSPLWLQKGTSNRVFFQTRAGLEGNGGPLSAAILSYQCPVDLIPSFERLSASHLRREIFFPGTELLDTLESKTASGELIPVQGSTMLTPSFALGSANRSDFWVQRRPLLAYWGGSARPPHFMQMRVIKNDYDFSSATFYSVQDAGAVLGTVGFRNDGGDKHPVIEKIRNGAFPMQQMYVEFDFGNWQDRWKLLVDGKEVLALSMNLPLQSRFSIDAEYCRIGLQFRSAVFAIDSKDWNPYISTLSWKRDAGRATLRLTLYHRDAEALLRWSEVKDAGCAFTCWFSDATRSLAQFDAEHQATNYQSNKSGEQVHHLWKFGKEAGRRELELKVRSRVGSFDQMDRAYAGLIDGRPVPMERLSDERILRDASSAS